MTTDIIEQEARLYDRQKDLPPILSKYPFYTAPAVLRDKTPQNTKKIIDLITGLLEDERSAGRRQAWVYCERRHLKLMVALRGEKNILAKSKKEKTCAQK